METSRTTGKSRSAKIHLVPIDTISGFQVRPGFYDINGATAIPCGVNFTVHSVNATYCELLLYNRESDEPFAVLPFPESYRVGYVYSMIVFGLNIEEFEYAYHLDGPYDLQKGHIFDRKAPLLDPYARAVTGQSGWGHEFEKGKFYKARVVEDSFDWGDIESSRLPMSDLIIYEMHVRGFTQHSTSGVLHPGTFLGLREKLGYLKDLGVNAIELMPIFEFDEMRDSRNHEGHQLLDYWGYNPVGFFAPNTSYTAGVEYNREGNELKQLINACKQEGFEVILDVVFNHTAEGNEHGPFFSFKGFDNSIYYMLTPQGYYHNFSGCGNTVNCNHPIVQQMIIESLRNWVVHYRVDGFRFDLASILGRNEDGTPMKKPPLLQGLAFDPVLGGVKLIAEAWDAGGLYQVGSFPSFSRWAEWNGKYRDDMRSFLKGDSGYAVAAMNRIAGSTDIYNVDDRGDNASVNFITCHDGFTLHDLYSYNEKHNLANGWDNTDGTNDNRSWNCGVEGPTHNEEILKLRRRMMKNACAVLMCSRGTPMFFSGDEFCNTQFGNNNPYCQDNEISWLNWAMLEDNQDMFAFFKAMIEFRKMHRVVRRAGEEGSSGLPDTSFHGEKAWKPDSGQDNRSVAVMFAGACEQNADTDDIVYIAVNAHWDPREMEVPLLPMGYSWRIQCNTGAEKADEVLPKRENARLMVQDKIMLQPRSVMVLYADKDEHPEYKMWQEQ